MTKIVVLAIKISDLNELRKESRNLNISIPEYLEIWKFEKFNDFNI